MQEKFPLLHGDPSGVMTRREFLDAMRRVAAAHPAGSPKAVTAGLNVILRCLESHGFYLGLDVYRELAPQLFANADAFDTATKLIGNDQGDAYADDVAAAAESVGAAHATGGDDGGA